MTANGPEHRVPLTIDGTVYDRDGHGQWYVCSDSDLLPCGARLNAVLERLAAVEQLLAPVLPPRPEGKP